MSLSTYPARLALNKDAEWRAYGDRERAVLNLDALAEAAAVITAWPGYAPTPLADLPHLAAELGVGAIAFKDESRRFSLNSFKALGGAYAVARLLGRELASRLGRSEALSQAELTSGAHADLARQITVTCATDGNHGRSVAWGAETFGCRCVIFIHATVSEGRKQAIEAFGAEVRRVPGNYDDSVRAAQEAADANGWFVVSDTSYPGYTDVPRDVMQGYALMAAEADRQWPDPWGADRSPTHIVLQAGVGGVAAAVISYFWEKRGHLRPLSIAVEPENAACVFDSVEAGRRVPVAGDLDTIMAGLACGEVSLIAWDVLRSGLDAAIAIPDWTAEDLMRRLADGIEGDVPIVSGESGVTGLAGLIAAAQDQDVRHELKLGPESRVLVFGTEGATDPDLYRSIVGREAADVAAHHA